MTKLFHLDSLCILLIRFAIKLIIEAIRVHWLVSRNTRVKGSIISIATSKDKFRTSTWVFPSGRRIPRWVSCVPHQLKYTDFPFYLTPNKTKWDTIIIVMASSQILYKIIINKRNKPHSLINQIKNKDQEIRRKFKLIRNWTETLKNFLVQTLEWDQDDIWSTSKNKPPWSAIAPKIHEWDRAIKLSWRRKSEKMIKTIKNRLELILLQL